EKFQAITGSGPNKGGGRLSELENRLIDMSFDRLSGGGDDEDGDSGDPMGSAVKLAIKEVAPIAKENVSKPLDQEAATNGGRPTRKEAVERIKVEAAQAAARKVQEDLALQGLQLASTTDGRLVALPAPKGQQKPVVTPRQPGSRVVSETRTSGGVVKKVAVE